MSRCPFLHRLLAFVTLLALLIPGSSSPTLLAEAAAQACLDTTTAHTGATALAVNLPASTSTAPSTAFLPLVISPAASPPPVIPDTTHALPETTTQYLASISGSGAVSTFT